ncbi:MAG: hypothetical protein SFX74_10710 [Fimbriimonadaceae bacterium]|nr:hypothetical protein [Fimbriimonadaceae bacterium]
MIVALITSHLFQAQATRDDSRIEVFLLTDNAQIQRRYQASLAALDKTQFRDVRKKLESQGLRTIPLPDGALIIDDRETGKLARRRKNLDRLKKWLPTSTGRLMSVGKFDAFNSFLLPSQVGTPSEPAPDGLVHLSCSTSYTLSDGSRTLQIDTDPLEMPHEALFASPGLRKAKTPIRHVRENAPPTTLSLVVLESRETVRVEPELGAVLLEAIRASDLKELALLQKQEAAWRTQVGASNVVAKSFRDLSRTEKLAIESQIFGVYRERGFKSESEARAFLVNATISDQRPMFQCSVATRTSAGERMILTVRQ